MIGAGLIFTILFLNAQLYSISCEEDKPSGTDDYISSADEPQPGIDSTNSPAPQSNVNSTNSPQSNVNSTNSPQSNVNSTNSPQSNANGTNSPAVNVSNTNSPQSNANGTNSPAVNVNNTTSLQPNANGTNSLSPQPQQNDANKTKSPQPQLYVSIRNSTPHQVNISITNSPPSSSNGTITNSSSPQSYGTITNSPPPQPTVNSTVLPSSQSKPKSSNEEEDPAAPSPNSDEDEGNETNCDNGISLISHTTTATVFRIPWSPRKSRCLWTIVGDENCDAELSCSVDIPKQIDSEDEDEGCINEYLKVSDGTAGYMKFCGTTEFTGLRASEGLRDLFVFIAATPEALLKSEDEDRKYGGINCTVKCAIPGEEVRKRLPKNGKSKTDNRCVCGLQNNKDERIVGGEDTKFNEYPWQAAVVTAGTRHPECGSSVINDRFILSAAHCFGDFVDPDEIDVLIHAFVLDQTKLKTAKDVELGQKGSIRSSGYNLSSRTDADENTQRYKVAEILVHPLYNFRKKYDFDFALLRLDRRININGNTRNKHGQYDTVVTPVCLPPARFTWADQLAAWDGLKNVTMTVTGWGKAMQNAGGSTRLLQKLNVPYIPFKKCDEWLPNKLTRRMFCAGFEGGGKDSCTGDSGGPLTYKMPSKQFRQLGVVSYGIGCAKAKKPGVYAKVTEARQWIDFHTSEHDARWCKEIY